MCKKRRAKGAINYAVAQNISRAAVESGTEATARWRHAAGPLKPRTWSWRSWLSDAVWGQSRSSTYMITWHQAHDTVTYKESCMIMSLILTRSQLLSVGLCDVLTFLNRPLSKTAARHVCEILLQLVYEFLCYVLWWYSDFRPPKSN